MRSAIVVAVITLLSAAPAQAQAWLGSQGEISTSFVFSSSFVDEHDLNGLRDKNSDIFTNSLLADVTIRLARQPVADAGGSDRELEVRDRGHAAAPHDPGRWPLSHHRDGSALRRAL